MVLVRELCSRYKQTSDIQILEAEVTENEWLFKLGQGLSVAGLHCIIEYANDDYVLNI